jgi:hypothetical protein
MRPARVSVPYLCKNNQMAQSESYNTKLGPQRASNQRDQQRNWNLACLIQALTWFSSILRLAKFIIRTDHVSLTHLKSLKNSTHGKLLRYAILLDSFDYTIEHAKGKLHSLPDALSRRPFSEEEKKEAESSAVELDPLYLTAITDAYFEEIPSTSRISGQIALATFSSSRSSAYVCADPVARRSRTANKRAKQGQHKRHCSTGTAAYYR